MPQQAMPLTVETWKPEGERRELASRGMPVQFLS